ncbi:MAG: type II secretion system GspH family protein [bacterium]|nr:type II secretion system GspH family protein [bacterium]
MRKKGFTLAEILITLGIIGVIAAFTVPTFIGGVYNKANASKLASVVADYENIFGMMLVKENKVDICDTEFGIAMLAGNAEDMNKALAKYTKSPITKVTMEDLGYTAYVMPSLIGAAYAEQSKTKMGGSSKTSTESSEYKDPHPEDPPTSPKPDNPESSKSSQDTGNIMVDINGKPIKFYYTTATKSGSGTTVFWQGIGATMPISADAQAAGVSCNKNAAIVYVDVNSAQTPNKYGRDVFAFVLGGDGVLYPYGSNTASVLNSDGVKNWESADATYGCSTGNYHGLGCTARLIENNYKMEY